MASGNTLAVFTPADNIPPSASYATLDTRNGHLVLEFDGAADESAIFAGFLPRHYDGAGLTVTIVWMQESGSGNVVWNAAIERHQDETTDLDADDFAAAQAATGAAPATVGSPQYTSITFTDGAQMDSLAAGESFRLKITRDADNASDTLNSIDAQVLRIEVRET